MFQWIFRFFVLIGGFSVVFAENAVFQKDGYAINGYDAVAYHQERKPVKGNALYLLQWQGGKWLFSSIENKAKFKSNPKKYVPVYGGYCAWGLATKGKLYSTVPDAFDIYEGKLYLNYSKSIQKKWQKDKTNFIFKADATWEKDHRDEAP